MPRIRSQSAIFKPVKNILLESIKSILSVPLSHLSGVKIVIISDFPEFSHTNDRIYKDIIDGLKPHFNVEKNHSWKRVEK